MKMSRWMYFLGALFMAVFIVACDDDDNAEITRVNDDQAFEEFNSTTFFDDRDMDDDAAFVNNEFNQSFFDAFDLNRNGFIEEDELNTSRTNFGANATVQFNDMDANSDARLERSEFDADFESNDFFGRFDADVNNSITAREFSDGVFTTWDVDNDGFMERNDFDARFNTHFRVK